MKARYFRKMEAVLGQMPSTGKRYLRNNLIERREKGANLRQARASLLDSHKEYQGQIGYKFL